MALSNIFSYQKPLTGFLGIERFMFCYAGFTFVLALIMGSAMPDFYGAVGYRILFVALTFLFRRVYLLFPCYFTYCLRAVFQLSLLGYWYPDIYNFASLMPNTDPLFAKADQFIFGMQPSIVFSKTLSGPFWSELFYMGYFSYYVMIIVAVLWAMLRCFRRFDRTTTIILVSFMMHYLIFLFLQSAGPQFYFQHIGMDQVAAGVFPPVGDWFRYHAELAHPHQGGGLFQSLVESLQQSERPIAAFPSSHVGLSTIMVWLCYKMSHRLGYVLLPFYIILCFSTVYIGAHYAIDVIGGWISAILIYQIARRIYHHRFFHQPKQHRSSHHHHHHHHSSHSHAHSRHHHS